jgi:hypothetical protein
MPKATKAPIRTTPSPSLTFTKAETLAEVKEVFDAAESERYQKGMARTFRTQVLGIEVRGWDNTDLVEFIRQGVQLGQSARLTMDQIAKVCGISTFELGIKVGLALAQRRLTQPPLA